ncbi:HAMP domain-containing protein, partial [Klebsiella pneumoniae]|uniref:HAMP domain-containing protein n=1 Tax=Klebsiella pneumoniae TaxID=573 RepID=UPI0021F76BEB
LEQEGEQFDQGIEEIQNKLHSLINRDASHILEKEGLIHLISLAVALFIFILGIYIAVRMSGRIIQPLKEMSSATRSVVEGNLDLKISAASNDEV